MSKNLPPQRLAPITTTKVVALLVQFLRKQQKDPMDLARMSRVALWSYVYTDFFTWLQHAYLDLESSRSSRVPLVRRYAEDFQIHHDDPGSILAPGRGVDSVDELVALTATSGLLASVWSTTDECAFTVCTIAYGITAIYNHVLCHAESRDYRVPVWIRALQGMSLVPDMKFHQTHHRSDRPDAHHLHWSFLLGPSRLLEKWYLLLGEPPFLPGPLFMACNPVTYPRIYGMYPNRAMPTVGARGLGQIHLEAGQ